MIFRLTKKFSLLPFAAMGLLCYGASVHASIITTNCANQNISCTLNELVAGASITIDDKLFDDWFTDDASTLPVDISQIDVVALDDQPLNPGLQFNANEQFSTVGFDEIDFDLGFTVSVIGGEARIKDNSLELGQFTFGQDNVGGLITISEGIFDVTGTLVGDKSVIADNLFPGDTSLFDAAAFSPQASLFVTKNVVITGDRLVDVVSLDSFTQRFSQIPEPTTLTIMVIGLVSLGIGRRRPVEVNSK